jgi:(p)ppGpp synthase/HD superfamily hydrolase
LDWGDLEQTETRIISICVDIHDRVGIVHEITDLFRKEKMNINYIEMPRDTQSKHLEFGLEVSEPYQLIQLLHRIGALDNVFGVRCLVREMPAFLQDPNPHDQNKSEIYFPPE